MILLFLTLALLALIPFFAVYSLYYFCVLKTDKKREYLDLVNRLRTRPTDSAWEPKVTVLIPARNEESTISGKIQSIAELDYDTRKVDVIVVDDDSDDQTCLHAQDAFNRFGLQGTIIRNGHRLGANGSYNTGILRAKGDVVLLTDADVTIEKDSLKKALVILTNIEGIGAVTARMKPVWSEKTGATSVEDIYNDFYGNSLTAESAIYSTFPGYGGFILLRREALEPVPVDYGSKDAHIAFSTLKKGFRYVCAPDIFFYETISQRLRDQMNQKTRRAARIIQAVVLNHNMVFNKKYQQFGKLIFPLRLAMLTLCPVLALIGFSAFILLLFYLSTTLGFLFLGAAMIFLLIGTRTRYSIPRFFSSFAMHQFYLVLSLILSPRKMSVWNKREG